MRLLPEKTFTAIEAVLYVACHLGTAPVRSREICKQQGLTRRYLELLLQRLVRAGILKSIRGPKGGYLLARDRRHIALMDIHDIVISLDRGGGKGGSALYCTVIEPLKIDVDRKIRETLGARTIQDLCEQAQRAGVITELRKHSDFVI